MTPAITTLHTAAAPVRPVLKALLLGTAFASLTALGPALLLGTTQARAQGSPGTGLDLPALPVSATSIRTRPTLTIDLSIEYPTSGAAYRESYDPNDARGYLGYFDLNSCYSYHHSASDGPQDYVSDQASADRIGHFYRSGAAENRRCNTGSAAQGFSGNFLNWATASSLDVFRVAMTGGDRVVDTASDTVLQRAMLLPAFFNHSTFFPHKVLPGVHARGATPDDLRRLPNGTPYTGDIHIANCRAHVFFGTDLHLGHPPDTACNAPGRNANLGYRLQNLTSTAAFARFGVRVRVCDAGDPRRGITNDSYCLRYPNGQYKPVGSLQRYSDRMRVAVFGYPHSQRDGPETRRYGGVLRVPMKYLGPNQYSYFGGHTSHNPRAEWDTATGILKPNPDGSTSYPNSGAINYLNKAGRTGNYKRLDPVGELYYESLRYLQGLAPSNQAFNPTIQTEEYDGFDIVRWNPNLPAGHFHGDPHGEGVPDGDYSCTHNSIMVLGDHNVHIDKELPGNTMTAIAPSVNAGDPARAANVAINEPDFQRWAQVVAGFELQRSSAHMNYTDSSGVVRSTSTPGVSAASDVDVMHPPALRGSGYQWVGAAYWANTHDIRGQAWTSQFTTTDGRDRRRPGMRVQTFVLDVNENNEQAQNPAGRRRSPFFLAAKYGGFADASRHGNPYLDRNGNVTHTNWASVPSAGVQSDPKNYFLINRSDEFVATIDSIFAEAARRGNMGVGGALVAESTHLPFNAASVATADLKCITVYRAWLDADRWIGDIIGTELCNQAGTIRTRGSDVSVAARLDALTDTGGTGSIASRNILISDGNGATARAFTGAQSFAGLPAQAQLSAEQVQYLRGDRRLEGTTGYPVRSSRMGAIVNSSPFTLRIPSSTTAGREDSFIFAGANDGMLHAFKFPEGREVFAFIPGWARPNLHKMLAHDYHLYPQSYVDAPPVAANIGTRAQPRYVLVGGGGAGGRGVYALDVTNPEAMDAGKLLWEFTPAQHASIGHVMGRPKIVRLHTGFDARGAKVWNWFAAVPSGVNAGATHPAIYFLQLDKPQGQAWQQGQNFFRVELPSGESATNGLLEFTVLQSASGALRRIYAGDLAGHLWKLDFQTLPATAPKTGEPAFNPMPVPSLLFATPGNQPFAAFPTVLAAGSRAYVIGIGTGKFLEARDNREGSQQSYYVLMDTTAVGNRDTFTLQMLKRGTITGGRNATVSAAPLVMLPIDQVQRTRNTNGTYGKDDRHVGWYFDYALGTERHFGMDVLGHSGFVFTNTVVPGAAWSGCSTVQGREYKLDMLAGRATSSITSNRLSTMALELHMATGEGEHAPTQNRIIYAAHDPSHRGVLAVATNADGTQEDVGLSEYEQRKAELARSDRAIKNWRRVMDYRYLRHEYLKKSGGR